MSGNKKKIPCPFCNASFHSERERFVVNKFALRYLERRFGSGSNDDVPPSSSSAAMQSADPAGDATSSAVAAAGTFDTEGAHIANGDVDGEAAAVIRSGKRKSHPDEGDHQTHDIGDKICKNFPGHGFFGGEITRLPTSERPYYRVEYEDDDSEDIHANDISQYVAEYKRFCRRDEPTEDSSQQDAGQNEGIGEVNNEVARPPESETKCVFLSSQEVARRAVISDALLEKGHPISREKAAENIGYFLETYRDGIFMVSKASCDPLLLKKVEFNITTRRFQAADVHEDNFISQSMLALFLFRFAHGLSVDKTLQFLSPWKGGRDKKYNKDYPGVSPLQNLWKDEIKALQQSGEITSNAFQVEGSDDFDSFMRSYPTEFCPKGFNRRSKNLRSNALLLAEQAVVQFAIYMLEHPKYSLYVDISCLLLQRFSEGDTHCAQPFERFRSETNDNKVMKRLMEGVVAGDDVFDGPLPGDAQFFPRAVLEHKKLKAAGLV